MLYFKVLKRGYTELPKKVFTPGSGLSFKERGVGVVLFIFAPIVAIFATLSIKHLEKSFAKNKRNKIKQKFPNMKNS